MVLLKYSEKRDVMSLFLKDKITLYYTRIKFYAQVGFFTNLSLMTNTATNPFPLKTIPILAANYDDCFYQRL